MHKLCLLANWRITKEVICIRIEKRIIINWRNSQLLSLLQLTLHSVIERTCIIKCPSLFSLPQKSKRALVQRNAMKSICVMHYIPKCSSKMETFPRVLILLLLRWEVQWWLHGWPRKLDPSAFNYLSFNLAIVLPLKLFTLVLLLLRLFCVLVHSLLSTSVLVFFRNSSALMGFTSTLLRAMPATACWRN